VVYLSLDIYKINIHVKHFIALTKRESVKIFVYVITDSTLVNTSTSDHEKHERVRQHWRQKCK